MLVDMEFGEPGLETRQVNTAAGLVTVRATVTYADYCYLDFDLQVAGGSLTDFKVLHATIDW